MIFYFHPYLGKIPNLTNILQMGWNHQLEKHQPPRSLALALHHIASPTPPWTWCLLEKFLGIFDRKISFWIYKVGP